jgi:vancomycin aglycone glucosyltransferase
MPLSQSSDRDIGDVDHAKLLARVAAVVHHGGAGTTTTAAKSGGVGLACPAPEKLTVEALTSALRRCCRPDVQGRAAALASRIALDGAKSQPVNWKSSALQSR